MVTAVSAAKSPRRCHLQRWVEDGNRPPVDPTHAICVHIDVDRFEGAQQCQEGIGFVRIEDAADATLREFGIDNRQRFAVVSIEFGDYAREGIVVEDNCRCVQAV